MRRLDAFAVVLSAFVLVPGVAVAGGPARLLKDINSTPSDERSSWPGSFKKVGNVLLFRAQTHALGVELWKSDGTEAGTVLVKDIWPGPRSSLIPPLASTWSSTEFNGLLLFPADDGVHGLELWRSDGTAAGTFMLQDIIPGRNSGLTASGSHDPTILLWVNQISGGLMYFLANDEVHGVELWRTDGTQAGTFLLRDISPGVNSPFGLGDYSFDGGTAGSRFVFRNPSPTTGGELWATDGTIAGTFRIKDTLPGPGGTGVHFGFTELGGQTFFIGVSGTGVSGQSRIELWKSDGTSSGTALVKVVASGSVGIPNQQLTRAGDFVYLQVNGALHRSDGTADGTILLHSFNGFISVVGDLGGKLVLQANDGVHGPEPWVSDGTPGGTFMLEDITPAGINPGFQTIVRDGGILYFLDDDGVHGRDLWRTDGTPAGTRFVTEIEPGPSAPGEPFMGSPTLWQGRLLFFGRNGLLRLDPGTGEITKIGLGGDLGLFPLDASVLFVNADAEHGTELWRTDGTSEGTRLLKDIEDLARTDPSYPESLGTATGPDRKVRALYSAYDGAAFSLWATDGTTRGTEIIKDVSLLDHPGATIGGIVYFTGIDPVHGYELWGSDGTTAGTRMVTDFGLERGGVYSVPVAAGGRVYFVAEDVDHGAELWTSDGTEAGTHLVRDITPGQDGTYPDSLVAVGGRLYFTASDDHGHELWTSDGTEGGTHLVKDLWPGGSSSCCRRMLAFNGRLLFEGGDGVHGNELWMTDGTEEGTVLLADINPGKSNSFPREVTVIGSLAFFSATDGVHGLELWKTDGTPAGTVPVLDLLPGRDDGFPSFLGPLGDSLVFLALTSPQGHFEMWKSDGSEAGTVRLGSDFAGDAYAAVSLDEGLLFTEADDARGLELWRTDGEPGGTAFVQDLAPGPAWSDPRDFVKLGTRVLFVADDPVANRELFAGRASILLGQADLAVGDLGQELGALGLPKGIERSLQVQLLPAVNAVAAGRNVAAVVAIENFIRHVEVLTPRFIDAAASADLSEFARDIVDLLTTPASQGRPAPRPTGPRQVPEP